VNSPPTEQAQVESAITQVHGLDARAKSGDLVRRVMDLGGPDREPDPDNRTGLFDAEAKAGITRATKTRTNYRVELDQKAALTSNTLLPPTGFGVQGGLYPSGVPPVASLFRNEPADGPVQRVYTFTAGSAAVVAEGAVKPDANLQISPTDIPLKKLATTTSWSTELADDAPALLAQLEIELRSAVLSAENVEVLSSLTASGITTGTATAATLIDAIGSAIASQESLSGLTPTAALVAPATLAALRSQKAVGGGSYFVDPWTAGPPTVHGLILVSTAAVDPATAWVVSAEAVVVYRRGPLAVDIGYDSDSFIRNLQVMRCEERMASAVVRPTGISQITIAP
jgi:HK97 family phage major capsid protein